MEYTWFDVGFFFLMYAFLGWAVEVGYYAVAKRRFYNRGLLTLPFLPSYGVAAILIVSNLPGLSGHYVFQFLAVWTITSVVDALAGNFVRRSVEKLRLDPERSGLFSGDKRGLLFSALRAGAMYLVYLVLHPLLVAFEMLLPDLLVNIVTAVLLVLMAADFVMVEVAVHKGDAAGYEKRQSDSGQRKLAHRLFDAIWDRLHKAYPGIREMDGEEQETYTFAKGLCMDKLFWVFLISAFLGDIIETLFCGFVNGQWMNRSSVLYGPFSFVWGLGAVVLTVTLKGLAEKNDRYVFLAGFIIGGVYEYMCSVFTELVFGTVFWDYSDMPLNIGGRTNVLFCFFWGVLAVVWIKVLYPPLSRGIEKVPALAGKIVTWLIVVFTVCNAVLTGAAMLRYDSRAARPQPANVFEDFLDQQYGDEMMEARWPNMIVTGDKSGAEPPAGE